MTQALFCPIRKLWLTNSPEENVRQRWIQWMTRQLGYPMALLGSEISLFQLPHLKHHPGLPNRRIDLIVFAKDTQQESLYPLLLIECKSIALSDRVLRQMIGYNEFVQADFLAAVNQASACWGYYHPIWQDFHFEGGFPSYECLLQTSLSCRRSLMR